jgi:hypothetical protein
MCREADARDSDCTPQLDKIFELGAVATLANIEARAASAQKDASIAKSLGIWILVLVVAVLWHMK